MNNSHQPLHVEFLSGEQVYLRPLELDDIALLHDWANDPETRALTGDVRPSTDAAALEYYQKIQKDEDRVWLAVVGGVNRSGGGEPQNAGARLPSVIKSGTINPAQHLTPTSNS
jgi:RimJ/RimL family protein N-acetyltransferase